MRRLNEPLADPCWICLSGLMVIWRSKQKRIKQRQSDKVNISTSLGQKKPQ